jgi:hypothetical protein
MQKQKTAGIPKSYLERAAALPDLPAGRCRSLGSSSCTISPLRMRTATNECRISGQIISISSSLADQLKEEHVHVYNWQGQLAPFCAEALMHNND